MEKKVKKHHFVSHDKFTSIADRVNKAIARLEDVIIFKRPSFKAKDINSKITLLEQELLKIKNKKAEKKLLKEQELTRSRKYRAKNKDKILSYRKKYYEENKEEIKLNRNI